MRTVTVGQLLINDVLPPEMRDYTRVLDKAGLTALLRDLMNQHPRQYKEVVHRLNKLGADIAFSSGSSFSLRDLRSSNTKRRITREIDSKLRRIVNSELPDETKDQNIVELLASYMDEMRVGTHAEGLDDGNNFSRAIASGARGNPANLSSLRGADLMVLDHKDRPIPIPIVHNFSEGLTPSEYFAGAYGTRKGVVSLKMSTAKAGYLGKQLANATSQLLVTDEEPLPDTGLPVETDDEDNEGAVLARGYGKFKAGTVLTPSILRALKRAGHDDIIVHSPISAGGRGVPRLAAGIRERGGFSPIGDNIGLAAAQAISEPLSQSQLCLAAGTLVRMADGTARAIEEVVVGEFVLGCGIAGVITPVQVLGAVANGEKECVEAVFRRGVGAVVGENLLRLVATPNHKILSEIVVRTNVAAAKRLPYFDAVAARALGTEITNKCDCFCAKLANSFDDSGLRTEPFALLLGLLIGDGCYASGRTIGFSCYDPTLIDHVAGYMETLQLKFNHQTDNEYYLCDLTHRVCKRRADGSIYRNRVLEFLRVAGLYGQRAATKLPPEDIHSWDNASVAAFIAGYLATDGCVNAHGFLSFSSNSRELLVIVRLLLGLRFGVWPTAVAVSNKRGAPGRRSYDPNYGIAITRREDVRTLASWLPVPGKKRKALRLAGERNSRGTARVHGRCSLISRVDVGVRQTYDIYVAHPEHLFVLANGLIVSNSAKHSAGVVGAARETGVQGFKAINQLVQIPKSFQNAAALAELDGRVSRIEEAPQGGNYVWVNDERHYAHPGVDLRVKVGDKVEAGDVLSAGIPNPADIVRHKHVGEGRRYLSEQLRRTLLENGIAANRRNTELVARGLINHVRVVEVDGVDGALPDDLVSYDDLARTYRPRFGNITATPPAARGKYLEKPVLHYSIGTRVTPSVIKQLKRHKIGQVTAHADPPSFEPHMVRAMETTLHDPDWFRRLQGFYIGKGFLDAVQRGGSSEIHGQNWGHSLAEGRDFGRQLPTQGVY